MTATKQSLKITVVGARNIGGTLGKKWAAAGHQVMFGVRDVTNPDVTALIASLGANGAAGSVAEAIRFGEVVVFAIPGGAMEEIIAAHAAGLDGKIIIDAANKVGSPVMNSAAAFAAHTPAAAVYRAFNSLGWENFEQPYFGDLQADLFYCGPEGQPQAVVEGLISDVGLRPIRVGGLDQVHLVDMVTGLWFALALRQGHGRRLAFKVLTD